MPSIKLSFVVTEKERNKIFREANQNKLSISQYIRKSMGLIIQPKILNSWQKHRDILSSKFLSKE